MSHTETEKKVQAAWDLLESAEKSVSAAKKLLAELVGGNIRGKKPDLDTSSLHEYANADEKIIEGVFTGDAMLGVDKRLYPVPSNYASKSHIVQGTKMKARIDATGKITYKIIEEIPFETKLGILVKDKDRWQVVCGDKVYNVILASVTYLKGEVGSQVSIRIPAGKEATYACIDAIVPSKTTLAEVKEEIITPKKKSAPKAEETPIAPAPAKKKAEPKAEEKPKKKTK